MRRRTSLHTSTRATEVALPLTQVRQVVANGEAGPHWYVDALPWVVRGGLDRVLGGEGRRWPPPGRELLQAGDRAGFWQVLGSSADELLLRAEVRAPGVVELRTVLLPAGPAATRVEQTVSFEPAGLVGRLYLLVDLAAREAVIELAHRRLLRDLRQR